MHIVGATVRSAVARRCLDQVLSPVRDPGRPGLLVWDIGPDAPGRLALNFDDRIFSITYANVRAGFVRESIGRNRDLIVMRHSLFLDAGESVRALRRAGCRTPVLLVSEEKYRAECIEVLDGGADDFVLGDIDGEELGVRIRAVLRKTRWARDIEGGSPVSLTYRESVVFAMLARRAGGPVSKLDMEQALFGGKVVQSNIIQTIIYGLRCKLGADNILTNRYVGYQLSSAFVEQGCRTWRQRA